MPVSLAADVLDALFPPRCAGCARGAWPFCSDCRSALTPLEPPWCQRCGRPTQRPLADCPDCPPEPISSARAPFLFAGPARAAILRMKFSGWRGVGEAMAAGMAEIGARPGVQVVTWVPLARRRLSERGYDQAKVLAAATARGMNLPVVPLLRRIAATDPQARRSAAERRAAMRGAFVTLALRVPRSVLLVDDVLTTGATAAACAEVLVSAGAREVHLLTAARALSGSSPRAYTRSGPRPGLWLPGEHPR
jgi:ComF family protein